MQLQQVFDQLVQSLASTKILKNISDLTEILESLSALLWSIVRRVRTSLKISDEYISTLLEFHNHHFSVRIETNLIGLFGTFVSLIFFSLSSEKVKEFIDVLVLGSKNHSLEVAVQSIDSLIDIFAQDVYNEMYDNLNIEPVLQSSFKRFSFCLQDGKHVFDVNFLKEVHNNLFSFLEYKKSR